MMREKSGNETNTCINSSNHEILQVNEASDSTTDLFPVTIFTPNIIPNFPESLPFVEVLSVLTPSVSSIELEFNKNNVLIETPLYQIPRYSTELSSMETVDPASQAFTFQIGNLEHRHRWSAVPESTVCEDHSEPNHRSGEGPAYFTRKIPQVVKFNPIKKVTPKVSFDEVVTGLFEDDSFAQAELCNNPGCDYRRYRPLFTYTTEDEDGDSRIYKVATISTYIGSIYVEDTLVDTGANHSSISLAFYESMKDQPVLFKYTTLHQTRGVAGSMTIVGYCYIKVYLGGSKAIAKTVKFSVVPGLPRDVILGTPQCKQFNMDICFSIDRLFYGPPLKSGKRLSVPLKYFATYTPSENARLSVTKTMTLVPSMRYRVKVKTDRLIPKSKVFENCIAQTLSGLPEKGILVARTVYTTEDIANGEVPLEVTYVGSEKIKLHAGFPLAEVLLSANTPILDVPSTIDENDQDTLIHFAMMAGLHNPVDNQSFLHCLETGKPYSDQENHQQVSPVLVDEFDSIETPLDNSDSDIDDENLDVYYDAELLDAYEGYDLDQFFIDPVDSIKMNRDMFKDRSNLNTFLKSIKQKPV
ncbi:hypothetical protein BCR33DRAFT_827606 [Rhizoclosmatium globosum]|uniref:Uncharacterized protein n=1 Tax=Rhizoclosmatium globosum TaxID=329046 RepID=A0A1Y2C172_9FUNG|nr:hypothetical protein BCR33DRAFT_827606 [Rhizoclosmatium globosum]|eukprot:ORY40782.1 hypothetical protein BCR33DRAFT_827606 [Rhizoclosmatium globosum]